MTEFPPIADPQIAALAAAEDARLADGLSLIPSENHASTAVRAALATRFGDKYAEGYPGARYYPGTDVVDQLETLVQDRAKALFGVPYANVQPYSGSMANLAVHLALLQPGDAVMGLDLAAGGHLSHGWKHNISGQYWRRVPYGVQPDGSFDLDAIRAQALAEKPKLIWVGGTALPRVVPWGAFGDIADACGAWLAADISHTAGLVAGGVLEHPAPHVDLMTTTTHKTLRGPRGAMVLVTSRGLAKDGKLASWIDKAIIPGLQGGPHLNAVAGIGVALGEASGPAFRSYAAHVVANARGLADALKGHGFRLVTGGTDTHLILLDLAADGPGRGAWLEAALDRIGLSANRNTIPGETSSPLWPSGLRLGTPAATTRGMGPAEMPQIAAWIAEAWSRIRHIPMPEAPTERTGALAAFRTTLATPEWDTLRDDVQALCRHFPLP